MRIRCWKGALQDASAAISGLVLTNFTTLPCSTVPLKCQTACMCPFQVKLDTTEYHQ